MKTRVFIAIVLFSAVFWAYLQVDASIEAVQQHAPDPEKVIRVGKENMRQIDALCQVLIPQMKPPPSSVLRLLVCHHYKQLIPLLFMIASLTGWCASIWLLAFQQTPNAAVEGWVAFWSSILLALIVGIACYLVLIAPFGWFKGDATHLEKAAVFPLLGGLFMRVFFERLSGLLSKIFDMLGTKGKK